MTHAMFSKFCAGTALFCTVMFGSSAAFAQGAVPPTITNIPGGVYVEWAAPVNVAAVQLGKDLTGQFEMQFNVPSVNFISEAVDKKPEPVTNPEVITILADYWIVRGKPDRAIPLYENSLKRGDIDEARQLIFQNNLAMLYSQMLGEHAKALDIIDGALNSKKDNVVLLDTKGLILLNDSQPAEAVSPLQRAVELSCQYPMYCMHLAYALHQDGRDSQSRRYLDPVRDQLAPTASGMSKENKAMYDKLLIALPPVGGQQ